MLLGRIGCALNSSMLSFCGTFHSSGGSLWRVLVNGRW